MNRYIVVNTKAKNSAVWETIGDNYTPSKGEVCIIVPPSDKIDTTKEPTSTDTTNSNIIYTTDDNGNLTLHTETADRNKVAPIAIKIGDGQDGFEKGVKYCFVKAVVWFTNMDCQKRHEEFIPRNYKNFNESEYQKYDNYDAINIDNVNDIPVDYYGVLGVPITFLHKHNPEQFEIIGATESEGKGFSCGIWRGGIAQPVVNGKRIFKRLFIRRKKETKNGN